MRKVFRKTMRHLAMLLAAVMILTAYPADVFAAEADPAQLTVTGDVSGQEQEDVVPGEEAEPGQTEEEEEAAPSDEEDPGQTEEEEETAPSDEEDPGQTEEEEEAAPSEEEEDPGQTEEETDPADAEEEDPKAADEEEIETDPEEKEDPLVSVEEDISEMEAEEELTEDEAGTITVTISANGGKFEDGTTAKTWTNEYNEWINLYDYSYNTVRDDYRLAGWSRTKNGPVEYDVYDSYKPEKTETIYAVWVKIVKIKLDANGGKFPDGVTTKTWTNAEEYSYNTTFYFSSMGDVTRAGYKLTGWSRTKNGPVEYEPYDSFDPVKDETFYAVWARLVRVTLHAGKGSFPEEAGNNYDIILSSDRKTLTIEKIQGEEVWLSDSNLPVSSSSKALLGWSSSKKAEEPDQGTDKRLRVKVEKNCDYYAVWEKSVTVTFSAGDYYFDDPGNYGKYVKKIKVKVPVGTFLSECRPSVYVKNGNEYNYINDIKWSEGKASKSKSFFESKYKITKKVTLCPVAASVKITWNANGGKMDGQNKVTVTYDAGARLDGYYGTPSKDGSRFVGWSKTKKASGLVDFENVYAVKNVTYYAIWKKAGYKITLDANGGKFLTAATGTKLSPDGKTITAYIEKGQSLSAVAAGFKYEKNGREMYGYDTSLATKPDGIPIDGTGNFRPKGNMKFYVIENRLTVTFDGNGGYTSTDYRDTQTTDTYAKGERFQDKTFYRPGYTLKGWYSKKSGGKQVKPGKSVTKSMTVYAHWKKGVKVTYDANGGRFNTDRYSTKRILSYPKGEKIGSIYNGNIPIPFSTDNSKGFLGWSDRKNGNVIDLKNKKASKDTTYYAIWSKGSNDLGDGRIQMDGKIYKYKGKQIKPKFTVYDRTGKKVGSKYYTVHYSDRNQGGGICLTVTGKGKYSGMLRTTFHVVYDKTSDVTKVSGNKNKLKIKCSAAKYADGYAFYAVNKETGEVYTTTTSGKKREATLKNLKKGTYLIYVLPTGEQYVGNLLCMTFGERAGKVVEKKLK